LWLWNSSLWKFLLDYDSVWWCSRIPMVWRVMLPPSSS
jgi:hypothetical protein